MCRSNVEGNKEDTMAVEEEDYDFLDGTPTEEGGMHIMFPPAGGTAAALA